MQLLCTPKWSFEQFNSMHVKLTDEINERRPVIIAGDLNGWAVEWGSRVTNASEQSILEAFAKLDVCLENEGSVSTFRKDGRESIIDVTFCSSALMNGINWRVSEDYTHSDHQAIRFTIGKRTPAARERVYTGERAWKTKEFDRDVFIDALGMNDNLSNLDSIQLTGVLTNACNKNVSRNMTTAKYTG